MSAIVCHNDCQVQCRNIITAKAQKTRGSHCQGPGTGPGRPTQIYTCTIHRPIYIYMHSYITRLVSGSCGYNNDNLGLI